MYRNLLIGGALLLLTSGAAQAQTAAGTFLLGGNAGFNTGTTTMTPVAPQTPALANKGQNWWVAPSAGYFVTDRLALGLLASKGRTTKTFDNFVNGSVYTTSQTRNTLELGPFVRYYLMVGEQVGFFGQVAGGYTRTRDEFNAPIAYTYSSWQTSTGGFARFTPGFVFFPTTKLGLELTVGNLMYLAQNSYYYTSLPQPNNTDYRTRSRNFSANVGLSALQVGAHFYFGG